MVQTVFQKESIQTLKAKIISIYEYLLENHDEAQSDKVRQLARKVEKQEFMIAFCGHFSAGKSTMINQLIGDNILPSSPIPTSANLVKVRSGEDYAKVIFKNEKPRLYLAPYNYELVKQYCKDGDKIEEIEISHSHSRLPLQAVIMDTPGIDSADDAHRVATESALHIADIIFYVMDYNHVQAELNFLFTKELTEAGKDIYLVINQIDKHKDDEMTFSDFQKSVTAAFASWGVRPKKIFYTSLRDKNHPFNEFSQLQDLINETLAAKDLLLVPSIFQSLKKIAYDHLKQVKKDEIETLVPILERLNELSEQERQDLFAAYQRLNSDLQQLQQEADEKEKAFDSEVAKIVENAYLMPFQTRELAKSYLESCQSEFKVGFLFSKQKTVEEKEKRLTTFHQDLYEKTKSQLEWHIKEFLLRILKEAKLDQPEINGLAQSFSITVPIDLLRNTVKMGARVTGDSILRYTEDVAEEIKKMTRTQLGEFKEKYVVVLEKQLLNEKERTKQELDKLEKDVRGFTELKCSEETDLKRKQLMDQLLKTSNSQSEEVKSDLFILDEEEYEIVHSKGDVKKEKAKPEKMVNAVKENKPEKDLTGERVTEATGKLEQAAELLLNLPGFQNLSKELTDKAERLKNKGFTVALFGAFSAGKSSFANALIGEKVLPVSPNPTTAAINKIKPVTLEHPHGTVLVKFKETGTMLEGINRSLKVFELHASGLTEAVQMIDQIMLGQDQAAQEKTHFAFLQACKKGYRSFAPLLGTIKPADLTEFHEFVANEERSCYVEWIELYYDCEITRKGITLVDTPGADSINARHTGVAFDYIKNSDAILFVTYYNHAFSKADREFLIQLGRVKESFQLDKMFFIINALDLAETDEEKEIVVSYVEEQLIKYGIRNPHLYALSSLLAIKEKANTSQHAVSGMNQFEQAFNRFISNDLTAMAVTSAEKEIMRVHELLDTLLQNVREDESLKKQKRTKFEQQMTQIQLLFEEENADSLRSRLSQEAEELIYYIKQRVFLRFGDFFKESFNPSTLREDGRNLKKAVQLALQEFLECMGYDFAQELRATTVRLDRFLQQLLTEQEARITRNLLEIQQGLTFSAFEKGKSKDLAFPNAFEGIEQQQFAKALAYFKNPKSFFEKNEKQKMSEELYRVLSGLADQYLMEQTAYLNDHYKLELEREFGLLLSHMNEQAKDFYMSLLSTLDGGVSATILTEIKQKLSEE